MGLFFKLHYTGPRANFTQDCCFVSCSIVQKDSLLKEACVICLLIVTLSQLTGTLELPGAVVDWD